MKKITTLFAATLIMGISTVSLAEGLYGTAMAGWSTQANDSEAYGNNIAVDSDFPAEFDTDDGKAGAIGLGYAFNNQFRIEGRLGIHRSDFDSRKVGTGARAGEEYILNGDTHSKSLTIEGFYDFPTASAFSPYIKAGIGVSRNKYSAKLGGAGAAGFDAFDGVVDGYYDAYADEESTEFAWNVGAGVSYKLNNRVNIFGEYQYISLGDAETGQDSFTDGFQLESAAHEVLVGLRANF